jgi:hypothetical protein
MANDTTACGQIITACDFLVELKNVKNPENFYAEVRRIRMAADSAKYDPVELMEGKRHLVALTNRLTAEQKKQYQDRRIAAEAEAIVFKSRLKNRDKREQ